MVDANSGAAHETGERRRAPRYPMAANVNYRLLRPQRLNQECSGKTVNISNHGLLFDAQAEIAAGEAIGMSIEWPAPHAARREIHLSVTGRTVWTHERQTAVVFEQTTFAGTPGTGQV
jgi:hypothetical protein